ncbi:GIY-YIG nuclease family protein [Serratia marcescens]|uniref:GIY-YIG nuclease family protein n=1 Tax=Serratia marcescens TaxID=615 RepID=UPI0023B147FD|nr:GIY-YIG nuclease family protein [Serratia marcescens]WEE05260.1 GIY-YIG nuclease family protein [Serratia marcescens]
MTDEMHGYVYILEVSDIDLPVCKIGMTTRDPVSRCNEINKSSTGDFIWSVSHSILVSNCKKLEKIIHEKLSPLRQKRREFFNLCADDAYKAVMSIFDYQDEIKIISELKSKSSSIINSNKNNSYLSRHDSAEHAEILQSFCEILGVKGRAFGQLNKPFFGMSDGNEGVQWNISAYTQNNSFRIGVNLEGKKYKNWPIAQLITSELSAPKFLSAIQESNTADEIFMTFYRDAWQAASRPEIREKYIGGREFTLNELTHGEWNEILNEALNCLDKNYNYQRRNTQNVTMIKKDGSNPVRTMQVSPHLTIWSPLIINDNIDDSIRNKLNQLIHIYRWMMQLS